MREAQEPSLNLSTLPTITDTDERRRPPTRFALSGWKDMVCSVVCHVGVLALMSGGVWLGTQEASPTDVDVSPATLQAVLWVPSMSIAEQTPPPPDKGLGMPVTPPEPKAAIELPAQAVPGPTENRADRERLDSLLSSVQAQMETPMPALAESDVSEIVSEWEAKRTVVTEKIMPPEHREKRVKYPATPQPAAPTLSEQREDDESWSVDPLLVYQKKIADALHKHLRFTATRRATCVLGVRLTRDGLVIESSWLRGSESLCDAGHRAAMRVGRLPMPRDPALYEYLNELEITLAVAAR